MRKLIWPMFGRRQLIWAAATALMTLTGAVQAHPHGVMSCGVDVHYENGHPVSLAARFMMDNAHSTDALASVRNPQTGQPDPARQQRLLFLLKTQMARANWLLGVQNNAQPAELEQAGDARLVLTDDGRVGVAVALRLVLDSSQTSGGSLTVTCRDPTYYWVTELAPETDAVLAGASQVSPASSRVSGCAKPCWTPLQKVATGPLAGSAQVEVRCDN